MILHPPFEISSRLLPAVKVGDDTLSLDVHPDGSSTMYLDTATGPEYEEEGPTAPRMGSWDVQRAFGALLSFLCACGEGIDYETSTGRESDNADLFSREVGEWAAQHSDELSILAVEIEETDVLIEEGEDQP